MVSGDHRQPPRIGYGWLRYARGVAEQFRWTGIDGVYRMPKPMEQGFSNGPVCSCVRERKWVVKG
jgi:hypothetical protein